MAFMISFFIIFGIITFTNGKPAYKEDSYLVKDQHELQNLLEQLTNQGKYDISLSHYEDGPKSHNEDKVRKSHHDEKPRKYYRKQKSKSLSNDNNILDNLIGVESDKYRSDKADESEYENVDDIVAFLKDLQRNLVDKGNYDSQLGQKKRNNRNDGDRYEDKTYNDKYDKDGLRCKGNKCSRNRDVRSNRYDDDRNDRDVRDRDDTDGLRCRGNKCARSRYDDSDYNLKSDSNLFTKKIKVSDDLDAVVLGMSDVDRLLSKLNVPKQRTNKLKGAKLLENVDLDNLLNNRNDNDKKSNVEAVVFDLTQIEDGDNVAKQIKRLLSQTNEQTEVDYEDYGNLVEDNLKRGSINIEKTSKQNRGNSKILAHDEDNNNVYVPQWLLKEVISRTTRDQNSGQVVKSMFPLTKQQKERMIKSIENRKRNEVPRKIFRRNFEQDVGVPFHLEVQGLGQVSP